MNMKSMNIKDFQKKSDYKHYIIMNGNVYFKSFNYGDASTCYSCAFHLKKQCHYEGLIDKYADGYPFSDTVPDCNDTVLRDGIRLEIKYVDFGRWSEYLKDQKLFIKLIPCCFNKCCGNHIHISEWVPKKTNGLYRMIQYECPMCGARSALLENTGDDLNNLLRAYNFAKLGIDITRRKCG